MLNQVPTALNQIARRIVLAHPNRWDISLFRKAVNRVDNPAGTMGGAPTLGGLGVLDSEDEENVTWVFQGHGHMLRVDAFQGANITDRQDSTSLEGELRALIEPEAAAANLQGWFKPKKSDIVYVWLGDNVKIAWEIVTVESPLDIPPYTYRYLLNRRDDLLYVDFSVPA